MPPHDLRNGLAKRPVAAVEVPEVVLATLKKPVTARPSRAGGIPCAPPSIFTPAAGNVMFDPAGMPEREPPTCESKPNQVWNSSVGDAE